MTREGTNDQLKPAEKKTSKKYQACRLLASADKARFADVSTYLEKEIIASGEKRPADVTAGYSFLENWRQRETHWNNLQSDRVSFAHGGTSSRVCNEPAPKKWKDRSEVRATDVAT